MNAKWITRFALVVTVVLCFSVVLLSGTALAASKVQDRYLDSMIASSTIVSITMVYGEKLEARILAYDDEVVEVDSWSGKTMLLYKDAIAAIAVRD